MAGLFDRPPRRGLFDTEPGRLDPSDVLQIMPQIDYQNMGAARGRVARQPPRLPVRPAREDVGEVASALSNYAVPAGNRTMPITRLSGGTREDAPDEAARIATLVKQMSGDKGYISRLIVDQDGNVIEGQHRLEALRQLGVSDVPVTVVRDLSKGLPVDRMVAAVKQVGGLHPEQQRGVVREVLNMIHEGGSSIERARAMFEAPPGWEKYFDAALTAAGSD